MQAKSNFSDCSRGKRYYYCFFLQNVRKTFYESSSPEQFDSDQPLLDLVVMMPIQLKFIVKCCIFEATMRPEMKTR